MVIKNVGPTEKRILIHLANHPHKFLKEIKEEMGIEDKKSYDTSAISKAIKRLNEEKNLVCSYKTGITEKKVEWPLWALCIPMR